MIDSVKQSLTWWEIRTMQATNLEDVDFPDIVALDKEGQIILIAEVKGSP
jgi:tRNA A-37 threonylcarbamoyl transferase component Bud32